MEQKNLKTVYTCYPEGKYKVLTMSYDDGLIYDRKLIEIFNKYGIKGTFHLNGGHLLKEPNRITFDEIKETYKGHEVSCHTYTHPTIERCPLSQVVQEIIEDRKVLEAAVGYPVRGLSYPNGSFSKEIIDLLPACGIEYSRTVNNTKWINELPDNFLKWDSTCHHNNPRLMEFAKALVEADKSQYLFMMYVWGHSYEFNNDNNWDMMEEFCKYVGGRDDIWYATNIEIVDYMNAAKRLKFTAEGDKVYNPNAMSVWISVDGKIVEIKGGELKEI